MTPFVDPHMRHLLEAMRAAPSLDYARMPIAEARRAFESGAAPWREGLPMVATRDLAVPSAGGGMRARLFLPSPARLPLIVFVHGGGWTFGSVDTHENEMRRLAIAAQAAVLGIDYQLAPEHPFPAGLEDTRAAIAFARAGGLGSAIDARRIALAGDSAGANLALSAMIEARDRGEAPVAAGALFYGCYAPDFDTPSHAAFGGGAFGLSSDRMRWYWRNFLGSAGEDTRTLAAPLRADLAGLPPLHLVAAGLDPLLDDTLTLSRLLAYSGVPHRCDVVPGVVHGFLRMARELPAAEDAIRAAGDVLSNRLKKQLEEETR